jgi:hypothetical protein
MSTAQVALDTTQYVRVTQWENRILLQCLRDAVRIVMSTDKPSRNNTSYHLLSGAMPVLPIDVIDTKVWALATSDNSSLIVTETFRSMSVASQSYFSAAGEVGSAYACVVEVTLAPDERHSFKLQKNSRVRVAFVEARGLYLTAVRGVVSGVITAMTQLVSTNGVIDSTFVGLLEEYNGPAVGDIVLGSFDEIKEAFYPNGEFVIGLHNRTDATVTTSITIGVQQLSDAGVYTILQADTQLEADTEMSIFNGTN